VAVRLRIHALQLRSNGGDVGLRLRDVHARFQPPLHNQPADVAAVKVILLAGEHALRPHARRHGYGDEESGPKDGIDTGEALGRYTDYGEFNSIQPDSGP